jgi:hypothetical protein
MKSPDQVCESRADSGVALSITVSEGTVFVSGSQHSLLFLSELIAAQASFTLDDGFSIGPDSAGSHFFSAGATHGIYIHRRPTDASISPNVA